MINDNQQLVGARQSQAWDEHGTPIQVYDDGFGPLWLYREAGGLEGIVRAQTWESAYECCQDEIMTRVSTDDVLEAYGLYVMPPGDNYFRRSETWTVVDDVENTNTEFATLKTAQQFMADKLKQDRDLIEGYEYQPNATGTGIVTFDLNGQSLVELTPELADELDIRIQVTEEY